MHHATVAAGTAALFVVVALSLHRAGRVAILPACLYLTAVGIALAWIDIEQRRLPNAIVLPSYGVMAICLAGASLATGDWAAMLRAVIGATALFGFYFAIMVASPTGMGFGDVKLAGVIGAVLAYVSWVSLWIGAIGAFALAAAVALATTSIRPNKTLPFGPFMIAATLLAIVTMG